jgi:hypothetical protein
MPTQHVTPAHRADPRWQQRQCALAGPARATAPQRRELYAQFRHGIA